MNKSTRLLPSFISMGAAMAVLMAINFILTPYVTSKLGAEAYGFITLANTIVSYALMVTTALNSFGTRFIAVEYHHGNQRQASTYLSTLLIANGFVCAILFAGSLAFIANIDKLLQISPNLIMDVRYLFVLVFINFLFTNGSAAFSCAAYIKNRLDLYGLFQVLSYVVESVALSVLYICLPAKVAFFGVGLASAGLVMFIGNIYLYRKLCPELAISTKLFSWDAVKTLAFSGIWNSLNQLGNVLTTGLSLLMANVFLNPLVMGQVAVGQTFTTVSRRFYQLVSQVFQPSFLKCYSNHDAEGLKRRLLLSMKTSGFLGVSIVAGYFVLGEAFNRLWIPEQDTTLIYQIAMVVLFCEIFVAPVTPLYYIYTLTVKNRVPCFVTIVGGLISVALMPLLIQLGLGPFAVVIPSTLVIVFINLITNPMYMAHCLTLPLTTFYPSLLRIYSSFVLMVVVFAATASLMTIDTWGSFLVVALLCAVEGAAVYLVVAFSSAERSVLLKAMAGFLHLRKNQEKK